MTETATTEPRRNFLGIPVEGEINEGEHRDKQRPLEEFQPLVQALLDDPTIVEFGWKQYTPYFNDGEPCVFSASSVWVRTTSDAAPPGPGDDEGYEGPADSFDVRYGRNSRLGHIEKEWGCDPETGRSVLISETYMGPDEARYRRCLALYEAVDEGEFNDVLLVAFGDHARVTVRRDGIRVEFYEHD